MFYLIFGSYVDVWQWSSAVTNISLWPSNPYPRDFIMQSALLPLLMMKILKIINSPATTFLNQSNNLDPETTLYTIFFGIK